MVYGIRIAMFAVKDKMARKPVGSHLHFYFLKVTHFSQSNSCLTVHTAQRE